MLPQQCKHGGVKMWCVICSPKARKEQMISENDGFFSYGQSIGISLNDLTKLMLLAKKSK